MFIVPALACSAGDGAANAPAGENQTADLANASLAPAPGEPLRPARAPLAASGGLASATSPERAVAAKLGLPSRFAIGLGNDVTADEGWDPERAHAFELGPKLDIHYMYLSGFEWRNWNSPEGAYVTIHANAAKSRGIVPMFTLYQAAVGGDGNLTTLSDEAFMTSFWRGVRVMFERLGEFDAPAIAHLEPDLWGYAQQRSDGDPARLPVKVGSLVPECKSLPEDVSGLGKCMIKLARALAPKVVVGLSGSLFAAYTGGVPDAAKTAKFLNAVGGADADIVVVETLDRDAGCFELGVDPNCQRSGVTFWWDEANVAHPNFHDHLAWAKAIRQGTGKPLLWWQMPLGTPSATPGSAGRYRDNRVRYLFSHTDEFVEAGGIGAVFGTGAPNQTTAKTDGGQFAAAVAKYQASPVALP